MTSRIFLTFLAGSIALGCSSDGERNAPPPAVGGNTGFDGGAGGSRAGSGGASTGSGGELTDGGEAGGPASGGLGGGPAVDGGDAATSGGEGGVGVPGAGGTTETGGSGPGGGPPGSCPETSTGKGDALTCAAFCENVAGAECAIRPSVAECLEACERYKDVCPTRFDALATCLDGDLSWTCGAISGCGEQMGCISECGCATAPTGASDAFDLAATCVDFVATGCTGIDPQECELGFGAARTKCPAAFDALVQCAGARPAWTCDQDRARPTLEACRAELDCLTNCSQ